MLVLERETDKKRERESDRLIDRQRERICVRDTEKQIRREKGGGIRGDTLVALTASCLH